MRGHLLGTSLCLLSACGVLDPERREIVIVRGRSGFEGEIVLMERAVQVDRAAVMGLTTRVGPQWTPDPLE